MSVMKTRGPSNEKTVRHVPKYVSKQMHFIQYDGRVEVEVNGERQCSKTCSNDVRNTLHVFCIV